MGLTRGEPLEGRDRAAQRPCSNGHAEAFRRDNSNAVVEFLDTGHFALETHVNVIATAMRDFLAKASH